MGCFGGLLPVSNIVCYGPSTSFDSVPESSQGNYICKTRNLSKTILDIFASRPAVIGAGAQMASTWVQWGCLPTIRRAFCAAQCRASPQARDASTWGLQSVQSDGNSLALLYENGRKAKLPFDGEVWLKAYVDGSERTVQVESGTRFRWRVNGR